MKAIFRAALILFVLTFGIFAQSNELPRGVRSVELLSPFVQDAAGNTIGTDMLRYARSCLDLVNLKLGCSREGNVDFGTQMGVNRDLFKVNGSRSRMVRIGPYNWTDKFTVPYVEPWSELAPGEGRHVAFNTSGGDGEDGQPGRPGVAGMNGDGTFTPMAVPPSPAIKPPSKPKRKDYSKADVTEQVSSRVVAKDGKVRTDGYTPLTQVRKGHMYVVRLVEEGRDYYVLIRVDDVVTGDRIKISFMKLDLTEAL